MIRSMSESRFVLVLGMHRSGTSCLAGALEACGLFLGEVGRSDRYNAKGNREHDPARQLNDRILEESGGAWSRPPDRVVVTAARQAEMQAVARELAQRPPCGLKDPRILLALDAWNEAVGGAALVGTYRHPAAVAASLASRNGMPSGAAIDLWLRYNTALVERHRDQPFPIVEFDLQDPEAYCATVARIAARLGLASDHARIRAFVSAELDHSMDPGAPVPEACRALWEYLTSVAERRPADPAPAPPGSQEKAARSVVQLVSGPTCAGKSVYINLHVGRDATVLLPDKGARQAIAAGGRFLVHYNLLRPYDKVTPTSGERLERRIRRGLRRVRARLGGPFSIDPRLRDLVSAPADFEATVLVVPRRELLGRIARREAREPLREQSSGYPGERWNAIVRSVDLLALYRDWLAFLRRAGIRYRLVDARDSSYRPIEDEDALAAVPASGEDGP